MTDKKASFFRVKNSLSHKSVWLTYLGKFVSLLKGITGFILYGFFTHSIVESELRQKKNCLIFEGRFTSSTLLCCHSASFMNCLKHDTILHKLCPFLGMPCVPYIEGREPSAPVCYVDETAFIPAQSMEIFGSYLFHFYKT